MRFDAYDVAVQQPHALLNLLPIQELTPVLPEHRERLSFLGYPTVGAVANLPHRVLFAQFGKESIRIAAAAKGELFEPIKALYPERSLNFHFRFESGVFDRQAFDEAFKQLSHEAGKQLSTMECQAHSFQLIAEGETKFFVLSKALQKPISTTTACRVALGLLDLTSIDEQIVSFRLLVENLQKRKRIQRELNYQALGDSELDKQSKSQLIQQTVQSVHKNHGLNSLKLASEIMIPREQQVIRQWEKALGTRRI